MLNPSSLSRYHARMQQVLLYIDQHLDEDLSVNQLAAVAAFSPHHFHRQFVALFGIAVYRYIQLCRLKRASYALAFRDDSVLDIALQAGYESPEAFARSFRRHFDQAPSAFRKDPDWQNWLAMVEPQMQLRTEHMNAIFTNTDVTITHFPVTPLLAMRHQGDPTQIGATIQKFISWRKRKDLSPAKHATFNIFHDDPETTPPEHYRLDIGVVCSHDIRVEGEGVFTTTIPAGRVAVMRIIGASDDLSHAANFLYRDWLPNSGEEARDFPLYVQRIQFFPDVAEHEAMTDVFLPLK